MLVPACFIAYCLIAFSLFFFMPPRRAAMIGFMAGWVLLPVATWPPNAISNDIFTVEVIGAALPSELGWTKAVVIPLPILLGLIIFGRQYWRKLRWSWFDLVVALLCIWPILAGFSGVNTMSQAASEVGWMMAVWGGCWSIGRILAVSDSGQSELVEAIAWSGVPLVPMALYEGIIPPSLYAKIYGYHPFQLEGADRYIGWRPMGLLEHGNQFGIWIGMSALAWFTMARRTESKKSTYIPLAIITGIATVGGQSLGAILLYFAGLIWMTLPRRALQVVVAGLLFLSASFGAVYFSGALPVTRAAWESVAGGKLANSLRTYGRASFGYRVRRDQIALAMIKKTPVIGYGVWDWWRPLGSHPWGLPLLLWGQYGLFAMLCSIVVMIGGAIRSLWRGSRSVLPVIAILGFVDAWLNSYIFFPGLIAAGALSVSQLGSRSRRGSSSRSGRSRNSRSDFENWEEDDDDARAPSMTSPG
jgi:hypothetical protein